MQNSQETISHMFESNSKKNCLTSFFENNFRAAYISIPKTTALISDKNLLNKIF